MCWAGQVGPWGSCIQEFSSLGSLTFPSEASLKLTASQNLLKFLRWNFCLEFSIRERSVNFLFKPWLWRRGWDHREMYFWVCFKLGVRLRKELVWWTVPYSLVRVSGDLREVCLALTLWLYSRSLKEISFDNEASSILIFQPSWRTLCKWIHLNIPFWFSSQQYPLLCMQEISMRSEIPQRICKDFLNATPRKLSQPGGKFAFWRDNESPVSRGK